MKINDRRNGNNSSGDDNIQAGTAQEPVLSPDLPAGAPAAAGADAQAPSATDGPPAAPPVPLPLCGFTMTRSPDGSPLIQGLEPPEVQRQVDPIELRGMLWYAMEQNLAVTNAQVLLAMQTQMQQMQQPNIAPARARNPIGDFVRNKLRR